MGDASSSSDPAPPPTAASTTTKFFDASRADALVANGKWTELEKYLTEVIPEHNSEDVKKVHPGLFIIPLEVMLLQMVGESKFDEAAGFFKKSIEPLLDCNSEYRQFDLDWRVDDLDQIIKRRSSFIERASTQDIQIAISDYFRLYFPNTIRPKNQGKEKSLWQFAMVVEAPQVVAKPKLSTQVVAEPKLSKSGPRPRPSYRCLACQWICPGHSIASIHYHLVHIKGRKACPRVTQHVINRLNAIPGCTEVPNLAALMARGNKKRKQRPLASAAGQVVHPVDAAGGVDNADAMSQDTGVPAVCSVDAGGGIDTTGAMLQKVEAVRAISRDLLELLGSNASGTDSTVIVEKLQRQDAILQELQNCIKSSLEHPSAPCKELPPAPSLVPPPVPSEKLPPVPSEKLPPAPSQKLSPASSQKLSPAHQSYMPITSNAYGDDDMVYGSLENLIPEEDLNIDEANMEDPQNICLQAIPEEQVDQSQKDLEQQLFSPSTKI